MIDVVVKLVLFAILGEGNLIQEELIFFSSSPPVRFILSAVVLADKCNFMNDRITSMDHI